MSLLSFTKCFIGAGGEQAATALTTAMVKMAPETATAAELNNMEQDLDAAGQLISRLQRELADERHAYDAINARYTLMTCRQGYAPASARPSAPRRFPSTRQ